MCASSPPALPPADIDLVQTDKIKRPAKVPNDPLFSPSATFPGQWFYPVRAPRPLAPVTPAPPRSACPRLACPVLTGTCAYFFPCAGQQVQKAQFPTAWDTTTGLTTGVAVCIIDTGVLITHPDLESNVKGGWNK